MSASVFLNPFRPGAGHTPPYLAGRTAEQDALREVLRQRVVTQNIILTGLRGAGKTVLLDTFKPISNQAGWLWVGTDLSESASLSEERMATRILADTALITSALIVGESALSPMGFAGEERTVRHSLNFEALRAKFDSTPGLTSDKLKATLELVWQLLPHDKVSGIVFAYDEAQNLADHAERHEYPLSLLLEVFQSLQRKGVPFMLVLTGLPTLAAKLVDARTYTERMFHILFLKPLDSTSTHDAITKPTLHPDCQLHFSAAVVDRIAAMSGGYPYFIQFICKEVFDIWINKLEKGEVPSVPEVGIIGKLDTDFFQHRWIKASDRQRELLQVIATLESSDAEFTVQEIVAASKDSQIKGFSPSHVNQMLASLSNGGLVYKNRYGRYSLAVPMLAEFILRQTSQSILKLIK